ncbi:MAG: Fic family protein [Candidatus Curtissbacteria bacterium]|nr:Fic family protein [Candidatus Curtissbacteria bacterium]
MNNFKFKPPSWKKVLSTEFFKKIISSKDLQILIQHAQKEYVHWDKFKHYKIPDGISPEEAWAYLKFTRMSNRETTPIESIQESKFTFNLTKSMYQKLSYIDSNASGYISARLGKPDSKQKNQFILSSISEEAIASSQIEGANTSRKVAKQMILTNRMPKTRSEQMIINNYQVMQRLEEWKDLDLSLNMLIDIQKNITVNTLDDPKDSGRLRTDDDQIHVVDAATGISSYIPPKRAFVDKEIERLIAYANDDENEDNFVHPVIKASILHFWIGFLHPFVDGNGRTARAIFYWYLLKKNYWLFQYLSVSRIINKSKTEYSNAYLHSEYDEEDLTYFLIYKLKVIYRAIDEFIEYLNKKIEEENSLKLFASHLSELNERQVGLLHYFYKNPGKVTDVAIHQTKNLIVQQTASDDLKNLVKQGYLTRMKKGHKFVYVPNNTEIKKIVESVNEPKNNI